MPGSSPRVRQGRLKGIDVRPEAVRQARLEAGLSLAQLAEGEVTRAAIHLVENGKMRPSMRTLLLIARKTGRPISYFLPGWEGSDERLALRDELERLVLTEDFAGAVELGERLLEQQLEPGIEADVRFFVGRSYVKMVEGDRALEQLTRAQRLFDEIGDPWKLTEALDQQATALFLLEDPRALPTAVDALRRCERLQPADPALHARILLLVGSIYMRHRDWRNAARFFEKGLDVSVRDLRHTARMYDGLSAAYQQLGRFSAALSYSQRAFALYKVDSDLRSLVRAENNLGYLLLKQGELAAAAQHLEQALVLCDERDLHRESRAYVLTSLGELHIAREELGRAEARLREALDIAQTYGERQHQATALQLLGRLYERRGDHAAADRAFTDAVDRFAHLDLPERLRDCHIEYAEALQARGLLEESIEHWRGAVEAGRLSSVSSRESAALLSQAGAG